VIHQRQSLALGFKASHHRLRIHAQLDHLEGDAAAYRFLLLGHVNRATPAFTDVLKHFIVADGGSDRLVRTFVDEVDLHGGFLEVGGRCVQSCLLFVRRKQGFETCAQGGITVAGAVEKSGPFSRWFRQSQGKQFLLTLLRIVHG